MAKNGTHKIQNGDNKRKKGEKGFLKGTRKEYICILTEEGGEGRRESRDKKGTKE